MFLRLFVYSLFFIFPIVIEAADLQTTSEQASAAPNIAAANSYAKNGNLSSALAELNQAIKKDPGNARIYKLRGHVYYAMGDYAQSLRDLDRVVTLVPDSANAYCDRAIANSMVGNHGAALTDIDYALKLQPTSSFAQATREVVLEKAADVSFSRK